MSFTITVIHEDGLKDHSTTLTSSQKDLALAFVIYRENIEKHGIAKKIILTNDVEYQSDK